MAGQSGRNVLIKIADGATPEQFVSLAGIRASEFSLNAQSVDATAMDSPEGWRQLIGGAGIKTARVRGRGVFKDAESDRIMRRVLFEGEVARWRLVVPGLGHLTGRFHIRELKWTGAFDGEAGFSIDLESAGRVQFEAAL